VDNQEDSEREGEGDTFGANGIRDYDGLNNDVDEDSDVDDEELLAMDEMFGS
jgi:hypothetical protein